MVRTRNTVLWLVVAALLVNPANLAFAQTSSTRQQAPSGAALEAGFKNPPDAARPRVWWHWMNGNITKDGIQKDLEWMKRADIGGFQNFDASLFTPQVVGKKLIYMTPEWKDAFRFTTELADKFGLEMANAGSPGWSESGGPWVPAKDGMKKYVWTETRVAGGRTFTGKLPQPPDVSGAFQNVPFFESLPLAQEAKKRPTFYADTAVVAYRLPKADLPFAELNPKITASGGQFNIKDLTDGDLAKTSPLPPTAIGENAWIQFEFDQPQTFKALTIVAGEPAMQFFPTPSNRTFRVEGKEAELWHPETGKTAPASYCIADGRTTVPLRLNPNEAVFVVFRKPAAAQSRTLPRQVETRLAQLDGAWEVSFQPDRGAPAKVTFDKLMSWSENADAGVKYFSGTANYTRTVNAPPEWFARGARLWLDLGEVKDLAEVAVNGQTLGIVWKKPFRVDVTEALKPGANAVEIKVTNFWVNRLIGDQQPNVTRKYTYTTMPFYRSDSPLLPSGLLGPVQLVRLATE